MQCPVETYTDNYVDFDERWSRADIKSFGSSSANTVALMRNKIIALNVRLMNGVLDAPDQITEETLDDMQWEVFQWFVTLPQLVVRGVLDLGEAVRRQSLHIVEKSPDTDSSTTQQLMPISSTNSQVEPSMN
jgi:hypothetical protein